MSMSPTSTDAPLHLHLADLVSDGLPELNAQYGGVLNDAQRMPSAPSSVVAPARSASAYCIARIAISSCIARAPAAIAVVPPVSSTPCQRGWRDSRRSCCPSTMSKLSSSARGVGRCQPGGGAFRRTRCRPSKTPWRSRIRPIVRTVGSDFGRMRRRTSSRWIATAPNSPRALSSFSCRLVSRIRSSMPASVRFAAQPRLRAYAANQALTIAIAHDFTMAQSCQEAAQL